MQFSLERLGKGWSVRTHPESEDFTASQPQLESPLLPGEECISGHEYLRRLQGRATPLSTDFLEHMRDKTLPDYTGKSFCRSESFPAEWKKKINGHSIRIFFPATIITSPDGYDGLIYVCWQGWENDGTGVARWGYRLLVYPFYPDYLSAFAN